MLKSLEFQGKNVERALEKASGELNIPPEKLKHEVITYGSTGIFGLVGTKKARIMVFVEGEDKARPLSRAPKPTPAEPNDENQATGKTGVDESRTPLCPQEIVEAGKNALQQIVDGITTDASVNVAQKGEKLTFSIESGDSGILIGKRGQTLEAMQYLLEKMINRKSKNRVRVLVDVEGYLGKRKDNLQRLASRLAEKAIRIKKPVTIGQMNAHDRRIVHIHLKDENGVRTQSLGEGYYRKLMIFPKKRAGSRRRNENPKD